MDICGQNFEFSALNANDVERVETAQRHMEAASDREKQRQHTGMADILRGQCRLVMHYLDEVLGEGASERLGLDSNDFGACARVMQAFKDACTAEQEAVTQAAAVPMNREQRRAAAKQHKQKPVSHSEGFHPQVTARPALPVTEKSIVWPDTEADARRKTDQLIDARQAVNALLDDPDAMQQLAEYALQLAAERHV